MSSSTTDSGSCWKASGFTGRFTALEGAAAGRPDLSGAVLLGLIGLSAARGRLFCNTLCRWARCWGWFPFRPVQDPHSPGCLRAVRPVFHSLQGRLYPAENQGSGFQSLRGLFQLHDRVRDARHRLCVVGAGTIAPFARLPCRDRNRRIPRHRASCRLVQGREGTTGVCARVRRCWSGWRVCLGRQASKPSRATVFPSIGQRQDLAGGAARRP